MKEIRAAARERMKGHCRVCPVCDGKACSGEVPGMGGLGTGASFRNNREALNACKLNMTALHDAREPRTNCTILGIDLSFPVMAAPIGGVSFNMSDAMSGVNLLSFPASLLNPLRITKELILAAMNATTVNMREITSSGI